MLAELSTYYSTSYLVGHLEAKNLVTCSILPMLSMCSTAYGYP